MIARYPNRDLVQLTNEDPAQATIETTVIEQALADASAEIDGYLDGRFALPLTDPPVVLNRLACDVAMYRLQVLRPIHDIADARKRYDDAVELLVRVARGEVTLGLAADKFEPADGENEIAITTGDGMQPGWSDRIFSRRLLRSY